MAITTGQDKNLNQLWNWLGIDPKTTRSVIIRIPCDDVVIVELEQYLDINKDKTLGIKKFNLTPIEE